MDAPKTIRRRLSKASHAVSDHVPDLAQLSKTLHWDDLEDWMRDNEYIRSGYRRAQNHWKGTFQSVFGYLHNETVNIHSHLWGAVLFIYLMLTVYSSHIQAYPTATWADMFIFQAFLVSAVICLGMSAFFHTSTCHSHQVAVRCVALDYTGIITLILGSMYGSIYYGFFCHPQYQMVYIGILTCAGLGASVVVLQPEYAKASHRGLRTSIFVGLGLTGAIPVAHTLYTHGFSRLMHDMGAKWLLASAALYLVGASLYANRIPERLAPGRFDYFFSSHQIFHVCVVLAALAHFMHISTGLDYWHSQHDSCGA
ncbi:HlyIII-domain-containing protein [Cylindrobasidium torrendii FP15055 ss-10]|uniref:HlyIII-domain-containing protein n=1 Tax=Cylindrobasidium torrendii FP15055 ss-10 TaxID=1314674 RepID=A0A0D7BRB0_9AGAR|nr:HlyIII-domain-containing protein [Cylindrobasidium torrendii FP15055 ss-10]